jgi:cystathionine beta-lyase/cystathionine gamma-synthase
LRGGSGRRHPGFAFASGLATISTVLELLDAGSHVVSGNDLYGGTFRLFDKVRQRSAGHRFSFVDLTDLAAFEAALQDDTRMVMVETPTNPLLRLSDLAAIARICRARGIICVADNTFASPYIQRPLELGFDIVLHSTTKYLNGHSDVIGGIAVVGQNAELAERLGFAERGGAIAGPFDAFLTLRGVKTLALRMERHCSNALELAQWLERQPQVARVYYPGLASHPQHELARRQMRGFGGMISLDLNTDWPAPALPRKREDLCPGRKPGGRGKPDRAPGDHDPPPSPPKPVHSWGSAMRWCACPWGSKMSKTCVGIWLRRWRGSEVAGRGSMEALPALRLRKGHGISGSTILSQGQRA